ncbi:hypothetical protein Misp06_02536 [Microbulbifer sp. NBRC 101763]|uniref:hypothetical protein n=1 Tax=Microbulbifer sp. NBRC 101763 TaxID=1113820 RepID=UPI0030B19970
MKIIELRYRGNGVAQIILGGATIAGAYLFWASSMNLETLAFFSISVGVFGLAFILLGLKTLRYKPLPIKYGNGEVWLPENVGSRNYVKIKVHEIQKVFIKSHVPNYIKTLEVFSADGASSISLEAIPKIQLGELLNYLGEHQC